MNACIRFCCSSGIPIVIMAVLAEVIFFSRYILRELSSLTRTANSPNRFARIKAPAPLKKEALMVRGMPLGSKSRPIRNRQDVYVQIQYCVYSDSVKMLYVCHPYISFKGGIQSLSCLMMPYHRQL